MKNMIEKVIDHMLEMDAVVVQLQTEGHGNWSEVTPNTCWFLFCSSGNYVLFKD